MLRRSPEKIADKTFDLLVIGGGINGVAIAWEAVLRGLSVALAERGDYGSGSSAGNFRTLHGGLRYLQHADLPRLFESVREQNYFLRVAPHLTRPLPFLVPCSGYGMKSRGILSAGLTLYELLARTRNSGVDPERILPKARLLSKEETSRRAPHLSSHTGSVLFHDAQMTQPDRLTLAFVQSAAARGAVVSNYLSASLLARTKDGIRVTLKDEESGGEFTALAKVVVNATGPWSEKTVGALLGRPVIRDSFLFSKGLQLFFRKQVVDCAVAVESRHRDILAVVSRGSRSYFLMPWRGGTIAGTADIVHRDDPERCELKKEEGERFFEEIQDAYPDTALSAPELLFGGLRPVEPAVKAALRGDYGSIEAAHRDQIKDHTADGFPELISVVGIKYTTVRSVAEKVVDGVFKRLGKAFVKSNSLAAPLHGGEIHSLKSFREEMGRALSPYCSEPEQLALDYGTDAKKLLQIFTSDKSASELLCPGVTSAQLQLAVTDESALHLSDVIFRRTVAGTTRRLTREELLRVGSEMGKLCGWTEDRVQSEVSVCGRGFGICL